jgi:hypothetical protein
VTTSPVSQKNDAEEQKVGPHAVLAHDFGQMPVHMQDEISQGDQKFHMVPPSGGWAIDAGPPP